MKKSRCVLSMLAVSFLFSSSLLADNCLEDMVEIAPDLCIDRYEAAINSEGFAVSAPGLTPVTNVSMFEAEQACFAVGRRLCTSAEWLQACRGPANNIYPYGNTFQPGACNDSGSLASTGAYPSCVSDTGVFDLVGNVNEWIDDPSGIIRGGSFTDITINGDGCLNIITAFSPGHIDGQTGFRCCCDSGGCGSPPTPNTPPVADAGSDQTIYLGNSASLEGSATDPDGDDIVLWQWEIYSANPDANFSIADPTSPITTFTTDTIGDYVISLTVWDGQEWSEPDTVVITVVANQPPTAVATADPLTGPAPLTVTFDGTGSFDPEGGPLDANWNFGESVPIGGLQAVHTYNSPGTYQAILTVVDEHGLVDTDALDITVLPPSNSPPTAEPVATPNPGTAPQVVQFMANANDADGNALIYVWDFGDGNISTETNPQHLYTDAGNYTVYLTVSDGTDDVTESLLVVIDPAAMLSVISAKVVRHPHRHDKGMVTLRADFDAPLPAPADTISVNFDGINLVEATFSEFKPGKKPNVYWLVKRRLLVRINFDTQRVLVKRHRVDLTPFDNNNGVNVELMFGDTVGVETIQMEMLNPLVYRYHRPE